MYIAVGMPLQKVVSGLSSMGTTSIALACGATPSAASLTGAACAVGNVLRGSSSINCPEPPEPPEPPLPPELP